MVVIQTLRIVHICRLEPSYHFDIVIPCFYDFHIINTPEPVVCTNVVKTNFNLVCPRTSTFSRSDINRFYFTWYRVCVNRNFRNCIHCKRSPCCTTIVGYFHKILFLKVSVVLRKSDVHCSISSTRKIDVSLKLKVSILYT